MAKLVSSLILALFSVGMFGLPVLAATDNTCDISNTGPGSSNTCEVDEDTDIDIDNDNDIDIDLDCDQDAGTGDAEVGGNTTGGGAQSGDANNECDTDVDVSIDNGGAPCVDCEEEPEDEDGGDVTPPAGQNGGRGGDDEGEVAGVTTLPDTGDSTTAKTLGFSALVLTGATTALTGGVSLFRRFYS